MYMFTDINRLGFYIISFVTTIVFVKHICNLNKLPFVRKFTAIILGLIFVLTSI